MHRVYRHGTSAEKVERSTKPKTTLLICCKNISHEEIIKELELNPNDVEVIIRIGGPIPLSYQNEMAGDFCELIGKISKAIQKDRTITSIIPVWENSCSYYKNIKS